MSSIRTNNNPAMLIWAREEIGYSVEQAAEALGLAVEMLRAAEAGEHALTLNQLRTAADKYNCPFGYFYLEQPPHDITYKPIPDYRVEPGSQGKDHHRLNLEIKKVADRRIIYMDLLSESGIEARKFRTISNVNQTNIGSKIRQRLGVSDFDISKLGYSQIYPYWKERIESDGVLVYESQYVPDVSGVIGVSIFHEYFPVILIKRGGNHNSRKLFTLLHEYAHLIKGQSAINDAGSLLVEGHSSDELGLEAECNYLAAEILVPSESISVRDYKNLDIIKKMESMAEKFKVTYTTAAVCLRRFGLINALELNELLRLRKEAHSSKQDTRAREVKIPRENIMRLDMGKPMFNLVLNAYGNGVIDLFDASKILNLRVNKIDKLLSGVT